MQNKYFWKMLVQHYLAFCKNQQNRKAIDYGEILGNYAFSVNFIKNTLIRLVLHVEFITAMETVQKTEKMQEMINVIHFSNFFNCLWVALKLLNLMSQNSLKHVFFFFAKIS